MSGPLLEVKDLKVWFPVGKPYVFGNRHYVKALDGVSLNVAQGEVLSIVGESGCGKTTLGRTLTRLEKATAGSVKFDGQEILGLSERAFRPLRRDIQMIFQDPFASLNPRLTVEQILREPLFIHGIARDRAQAVQLIANMLEKVGLEPSVASRYPHEFSGGQRQRIGIARAMIVEPKLIIADEAVSALDVSIQAQVLNLLKKLQQDTGTAMLFISHDLAVVRHIADRIAVISEGCIVETARKRDLFNSPSHPYTQKLLSSIPRIPSMRPVA